MIETESLIEQAKDALPDRAATQASEGAGLARATTILALGNIASRVLGFVREILLSNYFGASKQVDALQIALTIPQDLYDLTISGHLNSALVPTLSEYAAKDSKELWTLVRALLTVLLMAAVAIVIALEVFTPQVVLMYRGAPTTSFAIYASTPLSALRSCGLNACESAFTQEAFDLSVNLLRLTSPAMIFLALFAVVSAMLFAMKRFILPGFAAAIFNLTLCIAIIALVPVVGVQGAAIGWVLAAFAQLALQVFGLRGIRGESGKFNLREAIRHPGVRRIGLLYLPVLLALIIDVLINRPFSYNLASQTGVGNVSYMTWATQLREFPMGLVGTAISLAILPTLARQALNTDSFQGFKDTLGQGIRLALTLIIPATVGIFVLAGPLIGLMFERGQFTAFDTNMTAQVLRLYLLGIPFAAVDLLLIFAFYARKDSLTPALVGVFSLACYIVITLVLRPWLGFYALMIADSLKHLIHMTISLIILRRRITGLGDQKLFKTLFKVVLATIIMGLVVYSLVRAIPIILPVENIRQRLVMVIVPSALGGGLYLILASLLRLNELSLFIQALRRKIVK